MVNLRKDVYGPGSMKGVDLVAVAYDRSVAMRENKETGETEPAAFYLDNRLHPDSPLADNQATLALVTKDDPRSPSGKSNSTAFSPSQMESIKAAAGERTSPVTNKDGEPVGTAYVYNADLMVTKEGLIPNTKTITASELSAQDVVDKVFAKQSANKEARAAAKPAAGLSGPEADAQGAPAQAEAEQEPALG